MLSPRLACLPLLVALAGCSDPITETANAAVAPPITTEDAKSVTYQATVEVTGSVEPIATVHLGFDVPGRLDALLVSRGDRVERGQALARLDDAMARAQLAQAEAGTRAARAQADAAASAYERLEKLGDGLSAQQRDEARAGRDGAAAQLSQAEAALALAKTNVRYHTLVAPIAGTVTDAPDNVGALVGAGSPLFVIEDNTAMRVKADVAEADGWIAAGDAAHVVAGTPGATAAADGTVERVIASLTPSTRRLPVEIRVDAPQGLLAHQFVRVTVTSASPQDAVEIPRTALVANPDFAVWVEPGPGAKPTRVPVRVVQEAGEAVLVTGELTSGARVVVNPPHGYGE
jgi:RND family efflux transporter MFP subunit